MKPELADIVYERIADLVARSWRALGVPLTVHPVQSSLLDPEALLYLTGWITQQQPRDVRLFEGAVSWSSKNHHLVPTVRLRRFADVAPPAVSAAFESLAGSVNATAPAARWRSADQRAPVIDTRVLRPFDPVTPALLRMRIRTLAGPSAQAEALVILLANRERELSATEVSERALFVQRHMKVALDTLACGGWVDRWKHGREYRYRIGKASRASLGEAPDWIDWIDIVQMLHALYESAVALDTMTPVAAAAAIASNLRAADSAFQRSNVTRPSLRGSDTPDGNARLREWVMTVSDHLTASVR